MTNVYIVRYGEYSDQGIAGAFSTKEKAQYYCDIENEIRGYEDYWIDEYIIDECTYPKGTQVVTYYTVCISKVNDSYNKSGEIYSEYDDKEVLSLPVIIEDEEDYICVSSTTSLEHAKKVAFDAYYKWKAQQEGVF